MFIFFSTLHNFKFQHEKMKQVLEVKPEMAKFLQQTLDDMAVQGKGRSCEAAKEFAEFFVKVKCYWRFSYLGTMLTV